MASVDGGLSQPPEGLSQQQRSAAWGVYWVVGRMFFVVLNHKMLNVRLIFLLLYFQVQNIE